MRHRWDDEQVAEVVHAANSVIQGFLGDTEPSQPWASERTEIRQSAVRGVQEARARHLTPEELWRVWAEGKRAQGWAWGPEKDLARKKHPCLTGHYTDLPEDQRVKDRLFLAIVYAMTEEPHAEGK